MRAAVLRFLLPVLLAWFTSSTAAAATYSSLASGYSWISPASHTNVTWSGGSQCIGGGAATDDDITASIDLGFSFTFGGTAYTQVRIQSNGRIQFSNRFCGYGTQNESPRTYPYPIPNANLVRTIRAYDADLDPSTTGSSTSCPAASCYVRYATIGSAPNRRFVVSWVNVPEYNARGSSFTFQIVLQENGEFVLQYGNSTSTSGGSGDSGWELTTSDYEVARMGLPPSGTAIRFVRPRLQDICIPANYVLDAGTSKLTLGSGATVNGTAVSGSGDALRSTGARTALSTTTAALNPSSFPSFSGSANGNTSGLPSGTYNSVAADTAGFTFLGGTYYIGTLNVNAGSITLGPGDYFIRNGSIPNNLVVTVSPAGPVRLFLVGLSSRNNISLNAGGDPANLQVFLFGSGRVEFGNNFNGSGIFYSSGGGKFRFGEGGRLTGAVVTSDEIRFDNNAVFTYSSSTAASVAGLSSCTAAAPSAFVVTSASSASTCAGQSVTVRAVDSAGTTITSYTGTVTLSTSTGRGGWGVGTGVGTLTETGTTNDGAATYTFAAGDSGQAALTLTDQSADNLTVTVNDSPSTGATGTSGTIQFRDNAFVITATDALGNVPVAGRPHAMTVSLYRRDTSLATPNCAVATSYAGAKNLKGWTTVDASHPAGATAPSIDSGTALGTSVPASNNVALTFTAGVATFNLTTSDVGKYVINLRDDSRTFASAVNIDGSSPTLTVRPFALAATNAVKGATTNPEGTATTGAKFVTAGETFATTVAAYLWAAGDDTNNDGTPDSGANVLNNTLAARFAWPVTLSASSTSGLFTPVGGNLGTLGGTTTIAAGAFVNGASVSTDLTYSEVGSIGMSTASTGYLNTSGVNLSGSYLNPSTGAVARIGRFHPAGFVLSSGAVTPSCTAGGQTYMGEPALGVSWVLQARNQAGGVTTNYRATTYTVGTVALVAENADAGTNLGARITGLPSAAWTLGQYSVAGTGATFTRGSSPDGPYDSLVLGVSVTDADGAVVSSPDMNAATAGACGAGCNAKALNGSSATRVRFGRLKLSSALGAPQIDLPVPVTAQYWNGIAFVTNAQDSCTRLTNTQFAFGNYRAPLAACGTSGSPTGASGIVFSAGRATLRLSKPNVRGSVDLTLQLGATATGSTCTAGASATATAASKAWLQGNWGASTWDRDPTARAVFGVSTATPDVIYQREIY
jgi:hypothetical protein